MEMHNAGVGTRVFKIECTMCSDTRECPECGDEPNQDCTMCGATGECPECGGDDTKP